MMFDGFDVRQMLMMVAPVLLALTVHEYAHALAAYKLGDDTAKNAGRLTLNPLAHLDPLGTLMLFFSRLFGWAKPVPFNPNNFKNPVRDSALVALAGPCSNFITALAVVLLYKLIFFLGLFKFLSQSMSSDLLEIIFFTIVINISLGLFNLLPLPPLDGFKVLSYFLPADWVAFAYRYSPAFFVLFLVLVFTGVLNRLLGPILKALVQLFVGLA